MCQKWKILLLIVSIVISIFTLHSDERVDYSTPSRLSVGSDYIISTIDTSGQFLIFVNIENDTIILPLYEILEGYLENSNDSFGFLYGDSVEYKKLIKFSDSTMIVGGEGEMFLYSPNTIGGFYSNVPLVVHNGTFYQYMGDDGYYIYDDNYGNAWSYFNNTSISIIDSTTQSNVVFMKLDTLWNLNPTDASKYFKYEGTNFTVAVSSGAGTNELNLTHGDLSTQDRMTAGNFYTTGDIYIGDSLYALRIKTPFANVTDSVATNKLKVNYISALDSLYVKANYIYAIDSFKTGGIARVQDIVIGDSILYYTYPGLTPKEWHKASSYVFSEFSDTSEKVQFDGGSVYTTQNAYIGAGLYVAQEWVDSATTPWLWGLQNIFKHGNTTFYDDITLIGDTNSNNQSYLGLINITDSMHTQLRPGNIRLSKIYTSSSSRDLDSLFILFEKDKLTLYRYDNQSRTWSVDTTRFEYKGNSVKLMSMSDTTKYLSLVNGNISVTGVGNNTLYGNLRVNGTGTFNGNLYLFSGTHMEIYDTLTNLNSRINTGYYRIMNLFADSNRVVLDTSGLYLYNYSNQSILTQVTTHGISTPIVTSDTSKVDIIRSKNGSEFAFFHNPLTQNETGILVDSLGFIISDYDNNTTLYLYNGEVNLYNFAGDSGWFDLLTDGLYFYDWASQQHTGTYASDIMRLQSVDLEDSVVAKNNGDLYWSGIAYGNDIELDSANIARLVIDHIVEGRDAKFLDSILVGTSPNQLKLKHDTLFSLTSTDTVRISNGNLKATGYAFIDDSIRTRKAVVDIVFPKDSTRTFIKRAETDNIITDTIWNTFQTYLSSWTCPGKDFYMENSRGAWLPDTNNMDYNLVIGYGTGSAITRFYSTAPVNPLFSALNDSTCRIFRANHDSVFLIHWKRYSAIDSVKVSFGVMNKDFTFDTLINNYKLTIPGDDSWQSTWLGLSNFTTPADTLKIINPMCFKLVFKVFAGTSEEGFTFDKACVIAKGYQGTKAQE